jgi:hypothetical protein
MSVVSKVRMVLDKRSNAFVQVLSDNHVLNIVFHHSLLGFRVAFHNSSPKTKTLVLHLGSNTKQRADKSQLIHEELEFLDRLQQVNRRHRGKGQKATHKYLAADDGKVEAVAMVGNNSVSLVQ